MLLSDVIGFCCDWRCCYYGSFCSLVIVVVVKIGLEDNVLINFFNFILQPTAISFHWSTCYYETHDNLDIVVTPFYSNLPYSPYNFIYDNFYNSR